MTLDRRVPYAFHLLVDRDAIIDAVYLGKGNPSTIQHLNWYHGCAIDQETTRTLPGYWPNKDDGIHMARGLLSAAGVEKGTEYQMIVADIFEGAYPKSALNSRYVPGAAKTASSMTSNRLPTSSRR